MLVGKAPTISKRCVRAIETLKWYGVEKGATLYKTGCLLLWACFNWRHHWQLVCVFRSGTTAKLRRLWRLEN